MERRAFLAGSGAVLAGFTPVVGHARGLKGYLRTNWSRDRYALGSYSHFAKGSRRRDARALAAPVGGVLFFAGEATHPRYNSTVHAAYESGVIAAEAVTETGAARVAVIGAGFSGLAAAQALASDGRDVVVFEARERVGGRVWTSGALGVPVDLGASWIHGVDGNPLTDLARRAGARTVVTEPTGVMRGGDGREMDWEREAPDWFADVTEIQHSAGTEGDKLNLLAYARDTDYGGDEVVFPGGYGQLLPNLTRGLDIRLGREVQAVRWGTDVELGFADGAERFDAVVVSVPLGVLKDGRPGFEPALPRGKQSAIARLGFGLLDKVYLQFDEVFWDDDVTWIATPETGLPPGQFNQWLNMAGIVDAPVIMAFNAATPGRDLAGLSDTVLVERGVEVLRRAYPR